MSKTDKFQLTPLVSFDGRSPVYHNELLVRMLSYHMIVEPRPIVIIKGDSITG